MSTPLQIQYGADARLLCFVLPYHAHRANNVIECEIRLIHNHNPACCTKIVNLAEICDQIFIMCVLQHAFRTIRGYTPRRGHVQRSRPCRFPLLPVPDALAALRSSGVSSEPPIVLPGHPLRGVAAMSVAGSLPGPGTAPLSTVPPL